MDTELFYMLWETALKESNRPGYVSNWINAGVFWGKEQSNITPKLEQIWNVAHMSFRDIYLISGLSHGKLAQRLCMPKRTVENWCQGSRTPTDYERLWVAQLLGLIDKPSDAKIQSGHHDR